MSVIPYGAQIAPNIDIEDIDLQFSYQRTPSEAPSPIVSLPSTNFISQTFSPDLQGESNGGLFNFTVPAQFYSSRGIGTYYFYLRPKKIRAAIADIAYLDGTSIRGAVIDLTSLSSYGRSRLSKEMGATGFMLQYIESTQSGENIIPSLFKIVTGSYRAEPSALPLSSSQAQQGVRYRLNQQSQLIFLALTPSAQLTGGNGQETFIGFPSQKIILQPTYFSPKLITVELTDVDEKLIYDGIYGNQVFNFQTGVRTFYDSEGRITAQKQEYTENGPNGAPLRKFSLAKDNIDNNEDII